MSGATIKLAVPVSVQGQLTRRLGITRIVVSILAAALALGASSAILRAGQPKVNKHENRREIDQLEEVWRNAILKSDTTAMSGLLSKTT